MSTAIPVETVQTWGDLRCWAERSADPSLGGGMVVGEGAVALLCSEQAGFITGQTIHVDGALPDFPMGFQRSS